ncbi:MAG: MerR family transcriptional regulator [Chloroflexota bacterium]|nr:MerR family transcriptional regulator [Chloroflexota bacterium]
MYTIKQAAARAAVSVPLLRAWERRYQIVEPERTAAGYRLYDETAISRLLAMRQLIDDGWGPSAAAASIRGMTDEAVQGLIEEHPPAQDPTPGPLAAAAADELVARFVAAAEAVDQVGVEAVLDEAFARGSFEQVAQTSLMPMMVALGVAWQAGKLDIAAEHAASHAMLRRLARAFDAAGRPIAGDRPVLVGLPPGARHELGALAFAAVARRAGLPVVYLGVDLPTADWVEAVRASAARAAVIGVISPADADAADRVADALRGSQPGLVVAFGGSAAPFAAATGVLRLPENLLAAVDLLRARLA